MLENRLDNSKFSTLECPITDVMAAFGLDFDEQLGPNRRYILTDTRTGHVYDFEVNTLRNEWISRKDGVYGGLPELAYWMSGLQLPLGDKYGYTDFPQVMDMYSRLWKMPDRYTFTNIRVGKSAMVSVKDISSHEVLQDLAWHGISVKTAVENGCKEAIVFDRLHGKTTRMLALPCEGDSFYLYNGACYRPVDNGGISVIGKHRRDQFCLVYDNWHDCLAMMEKCHRNHIGMICKHSRHLIINGGRNIGSAVKFLKENPDFREVRCLLPKGEDSDRMFLKIAEATGGTATECSYIYEGLPSMAATVKHPVPKPIAEQFKAQDLEKRDKEIGLTRTDKTRKKQQENPQDVVKKPELKIEPKGEAEKLVIQPAKFFERPRGFRR